MIKKYIELEIRYNIIKTMNKLNIKKTCFNVVD